MQMQNSGLIIVRFRMKSEVTLEVVSGSSWAVILGSSICLSLLPFSVSPKYPPEDAAPPKLFTLCLAKETHSCSSVSPRPLLSHHSPTLGRPLPWGRKAMTSASSWWVCWSPYPPILKTPCGTGECRRETEPKRHPSSPTISCPLLFRKWMAASARVRTSTPAWARRRPEPRECADATLPIRTSPELRPAPIFKEVKSVQ